MISGRRRDRAHDRPVSGLRGRTGGSAASSTRSTRAASPTATATGSATCAGIIDHLDHLRTARRARSASTRSGCRRSTRRPGLDLGYDVTDYVDVDPLFGTIADFDRLVGGGPRARDPGDPRPRPQPHERPAPVVRGLAASSGPAPYADWYVWRDPPGRPATGRPLPPNNWVSFFGGSAWTWDRDRGQFYSTRSWRSSPTSTGATRRSATALSTWSGRGSTAASTGSGSTSSTSFFKHPDLPDNPRRIGGRGA